MSIPLLQTRSYGPRGAGVIYDAGEFYQIHADGNPPKVYTVSKDVGKFVTKVVLAPNRVLFRLSGDEDQLWGCGPLDGSFIARFSGFSKGESDLVPVPKFDPGGEVRENKKGGRYTTKPKHVFNVNWVLLSPPWDGVVVTRKYDYVFRLERQSQQIVISGGVPARRLWELLEVSGIDMDREIIPVQENVLPWLEKRFSTEARTVILKVEDGWVNDISPMPVGLERGLPNMTPSGDLIDPAPPTAEPPRQPPIAIPQVQAPQVTVKPAEKNAPEIDQASALRILKQLGYDVDNIKPPAEEPTAPAPTENVVMPTINLGGNQSFGGATPLPGFTLSFDPSPEEEED